MFDLCCICTVYIVYIRYAFAGVVHKNRFKKKIEKNHECTLIAYRFSLFTHILSYVNNNNNFYSLPSSAASILCSILQGIGVEIIQINIPLVFHGNDQSIFYGILITRPCSNN